GTPSLSLVRIGGRDGGPAVVTAHQPGALRGVAPLLCAVATCQRPILFPPTGSQSRSALRRGPFVSLLSSHCRQSQGAITLCGADTRPLSGLLCPRAGPSGRAGARFAALA